MTRLTARFDDWVRRGDLTAADLGRYRIVYAAIWLLAPPNFTWVTAFPDSFVDGPPGPFMLLRAVPPEALLRGLELAVGIAAAFLLVGFATRSASVVMAVALVCGQGTGYSLGKIDHTIFLVLVPVVLSFAGWGDAVSVDALRRRARGTAARPTPQWPVRLLALLVGLGFVTAAVPKALSGWLSPATQAVQGTLFTQYYVNDRTDLLAGTFLHLRNRFFWESLDVATILLEGLLVVAVLRWRWWRTGIAIAALFHLGVLLVLNIGFWVNVLTDAAFVPWSRLPLPQVRWSARAARIWRVSGPGVALVLGVVAVVRPEGWDATGVRLLVVLAGAVVAAWYLARRAGDVVRNVADGSAGRGRRSVRIVDDVSADVVVDEKAPEPR